MLILGLFIDWWNEVDKLLLTYILSYLLPNVTPLSLNCQYKKCKCLNDYDISIYISEVCWVNLFLLIHYNNKLNLKKIKFGCKLRIASLLADSFDCLVTIKRNYALFILMQGFVIAMNIKLCLNINVNRIIHIMMILFMILRLYLFDV